MAILFFTVTLACSALDAKLQRSSVAEMKQILKDKTQQRDSLLTKMSLNTLEQMRQMKLKGEEGSLMKMKAEEEAVKMEEAEAAGEKYAEGYACEYDTNIIDTDTMEVKFH